MMNLDRLQNSMLVAPKEYRALLYLYKNRHPELSFKILCKDDLLNLLSYSFVSDPVPFLLKKGVSYGDANKILSLIRVADTSKNQKLSRWVKELSEVCLLKEDPLGRKEIGERPLFLLESKQDHELASFLNRKQIPFSFLTLDELGVEKEGEKLWEKRGETKDGKPIISPKLVYFPNKLYQYLYILSDIRRKILVDPSLKDRFVVLCHDDSDALFAQTASNLLRLPINFETSTPYLSNPKIKAKTSSIHVSKSFAFTSEELDDPELKAYNDLILYYGLPSLEFSFAYANLLEILSSLHEIGEKTSGVLITSKISFDPRKIYYVASFRHGDFYKVYNDKNVLTDDELSLSCANPSYVKTAMDRALKLNFLLYNNVALLSRPLQHLSEKIHDSGFVSEFGWEKVIRKEKWNLEGYYTEEAEKIRKADYLDSLFYRKECQGLLGYDHSFKGDGAVHLKNNSPHYSVTKLERYILCPFASLLDSYFPNDPSSVRKTQLGTLNHAMMAPIYEEDYDFDGLFAKQEEDYWKAFEQRGVVPTSEDKAVLSIYKKWLKGVVAAIRDQKEGTPSEKKGKSKDEEDSSGLGMIFPVEKAEEKIRFSLIDEEGRAYPFSGRIDKVLFTGKSASRYYTIIDYKSGVEEFKAKQVFLGPSIQLPLYYKALQEEGNAKVLEDAVSSEEISFGGFLIQHSFFSRPSKFALNDCGVFSYETLQKNVRGCGVTTEQASYFEGTDPEALNNKNVPTCMKSKFIKKGLFFTSVDGDEDIFKKTGGTYTFSKLIEDAEKGAISTVKKIESGQFPIAPTSSDLNGALRSLHCVYCPYDDICYKNKAKDAVSYKNAIIAHFKDDSEGTEEQDDE